MEGDGGRGREGRETGEGDAHPGKGGRGGGLRRGFGNIVERKLGGNPCKSCLVGGKHYLYSLNPHHLLYRAGRGLSIPRERGSGERFRKGLQERTPRRERGGYQKKTRERI